MPSREWWTGRGDFSPRECHWFIVLKQAIGRVKDDDITKVVVPETRFAIDPEEIDHTTLGADFHIIIEIGVLCVPFLEVCKDCTEIILHFENKDNTNYIYFWFKNK